MGEIVNTAVLVALGSTKNQEETLEHLNELAFLAETAPDSVIFSTREHFLFQKRCDPRFTLST